jgi:hypothetical protein
METNGIDFTVEGELTILHDDGITGNACLHVGSQKEGVAVGGPHDSSIHLIGSGLTSC